MVKGILFVLLALSSGAHARDTSSENQKKTILVVSVLDDIALTEADISSFQRYVGKIFPEHQLIHVTATYDGYSRPLPHDYKYIREKIKSQMAEKILPNQIITHLVIMDHGNTSIDNAEERATLFRFLGGIDAKTVDETFKEIFNPLVGRFSSDAFVMLEACSTVCDSLYWSQERVQVLMNYFKIKNGTLFGAYQEMLSMGYEFYFQFSQIKTRMKSFPFIFTSMSLALASQIHNVMSGSVNFGEALTYGLVTHVVAPTVMKIFAYFKEKTETVNWGYLYKLKNGFVEKIYDLNPYENQNELFLKLEPKKVKAIHNSCYLLFQ